MFIYLLKQENESKYKIGTSKNPEKRIRTLQTGNSDKIVLVNKYKSLKFYKKIEYALHNQYSHLKSNGEWFDLTLEEEVNFLNDCEKIENNLNLIEEYKYY